MKRWVTSDIHLSHRKMIENNYGPYSSVSEMNESIISNFNSLVGPGDLTYILGDFSFDTPAHTIEFLTRMNGKKLWVPGNHDHRTLEDKKWKSGFEQDHRTEVLPQYYELRDKELGFVVMCHFPIEAWNHMGHGSCMLHGHLHGSKRTKQGRIADVGMDTNEMYPYRLDRLVNGLKWYWPESDIKGHHD